MAGLIACLLGLGWLLEHWQERQRREELSKLSDICSRLGREKERAEAERDEMFQAAWELKNHFERLRNRDEERRRCILH